MDPTTVLRLNAIADFSQRVKYFVARHIHAVWQLELLLFIKNNPKSTSCAELSRNLYLEARVLEPALEFFANAGILKRDQETALITYAPVSQSLAEDIEETARAYRERRTALINVIYTPSLQQFADAFKFKQDEVRDE